MNACCPSYTPRLFVLRFIYAPPPPKDPLHCPGIESENSIFRSRHASTNSNRHPPRHPPRLPSPARSNKVNHPLDVDVDVWTSCGVMSQLTGTQPRALSTSRPDLSFGNEKATKTTTPTTMTTAPTAAGTTPPSHHEQSNERRPSSTYVRTLVFGETTITAVGAVWTRRDHDEERCCLFSTEYGVPSKDGIHLFPHSGSSPSLPSVSTRSTSTLYLLPDPHRRTATLPVRPVHSLRLKVEVGSRQPRLAYDSIRRLRTDPSTSIPTAPTAAACVSPIPQREPTMTF
ncbi:hypothetical protein NMY22_g9403 [Coprinellus aureogranulatus]|nr:hypothetical protein NMY22_g9403 [Coprinellus aureogranulatus]